ADKSTNVGLAIYAEGNDIGGRFVSNNANGVGLIAENSVSGAAFLAKQDARFDSRVQLKDDDGTPHFAGFRAAASMPADVTWNLPASDGSNGQLLGTNGSGGLIWQ